MLITLQASWVERKHEVPIQFSIIISPHRDTCFFLSFFLNRAINLSYLLEQVINERYLKAPLYPGGCAAEPLPPPQHSLYYHPPLLKNISLGHVNLRASYEDKPPSYRSPGMHVCSLEEIRPLNGVMGMPDGGGGGLQGGVHWDQRGAESPLPSWGERGEKGLS